MSYAKIEPWIEWYLGLAGPQGEATMLVVAILILIGVGWWLIS